MAIQGELRLGSDNLRVYYRGGAHARRSQGAISKLDAIGAVAVSSPSETATSEWAVYDVDTGQITLGGKVVLTRGENVLRGEQLVIDLESGQSRIVGETGQRRARQGPVRADQKALIRYKGAAMTQAESSRQRKIRPGGPRLVLENSGLVVDRIGKGFNKRPVVRGVSLNLQRGEVVGLLGPNGAGKTTCFYMITGLIPVDYGMITLDGHDITRLPMYRRARLGIGYLPQEASIFRGLTVEMNIRAVVEMVESDVSRREAIVDDLLAEFSITHLRRTPGAGAFGWRAPPGGNRPRVGHPSGLYAAGRTLCGH